MVESFPLKWPLGQSRTTKDNRRAAAFKTTPGRARDELLRQMKMLGASAVVISSNVATYRRGGQDIMYADQAAAKEDPGVAVYYTWKGDQYAVACDKWNSVVDNLQALNKTIEAIRGIERWGTGEMMKAAFGGFKELPATIHAPAWYEILGVTKTATADEIKRAYRAKANEHHPDKGGSTLAFQLINAAYTEGMKNK